MPHMQWLALTKGGSSPVPVWLRVLLGIVLGTVIVVVVVQLAA
jgi:hypothetical protein